MDCSGSTKPLKAGDGHWANSDRCGYMGFCVLRVDRSAGPDNGGSDEFDIEPSCFGLGKFDGPGKALFSTATRISKERKHPGNG